MCLKATLRRGSGLLLAVLAASPLWAQAHSRTTPEWRRIGNSLMDLFLASPATGPADRVWFSEDGSRLFVRTGTGRVYETADGETWTPNALAQPPAEATVDGAADGPPEPGRKLRSHPAEPARLYAFATHVYRSDDSGRTWANLTAFRQESIIGARIRDLAVSPRDPNELVVANDYGIWRSLDAGLTWTGLNESLPNLPVRRLLALPQDSRGVRVQWKDQAALEWAPGERQAWRPLADPEAAREAVLRQAASDALNAPIAAVAVAGDYAYAGSADGRLWSSTDAGRTWRPPREGDGGSVTGFFVDARDPQFALASLAFGPAGGTARVLRTLNGGLYWDDLTADLPAPVVHAVAADRAGGAIYAATDRGLYFTRADLFAPGPATPWRSQSQGLPPAVVLDVKLDASGSHLYVAVEGYGVYTALAPHRIGDPRVVNAADFSTRPAAPGSLLSVLGARLRSARAGELNAPVLAASESESQIQVPFETQGSSVALSLEAVQGRYRFGLPLRNTAPAIFVDRDGTPLLMDAASGLLLDAMNPVRSGARIQILATGLGRVRPDWPSGLPAPLGNPPQVVAPVRARLDRTPIEVSRATLAPGYVGFYLVEVRIPDIVNAGPAELYLEADGQASNRVRVYVEP